MGGKKKYIEMFGSFTEPFNCFIVITVLTYLFLLNVLIIIRTFNF